MVCAKCGTENSAGAKFCSECAAPLAASLGGGEKRKTVTVLFCDLTGSTALGEALDPERLRVVLTGYFERMTAIVERHGGSVEKFIGDAVMAVFGVPVLHEDDALRAVRAAVEMRDALPDLGLQARIGVMTGEVVTGTQERMATGDAVNVAARLEQAAAPGDVLIGEQTLRLVRESCEVERIEPLALKGKAELVAAVRLLRVLPTPERRHESTFVGREREQVILREAWVRAQAERRCELVTIVGDAGVGKSRLVAELVASLDATVVRGRCLPYGEGITYWPVVEVLKQLALPAQAAAAAAIRSLLGETQAATSPDELAWAFRKTLEQAAAAGPLVVVFDDIQWAEETFLDLVEHVALLSSDASILLVCLARPELSERRPAWPVALKLDPLGADDVAELIPERIPEELRERITRAAGGNPLFVGEMLAMAAEVDGEVLVPPTLQALLAARLDQLEAAERGALERGAIEGEIFHRGAVQALAPEETQVTPRLTALVRKGLIRPDRTQLAGEDGFRFRHLLIRDAAYGALPKATRADLHERFAAWLAEHGTELVELDEILGYHLEQAAQYRAELGVPDAGTARSAAIRLGAAGVRAFERIDFRAALNLLDRARALCEPDEPMYVPLLATLGETMYGAGKLVVSEQLLDETIRAGKATGDVGSVARARAFRAFVRGHAGGIPLADLRAEMDELAATVAAIGDAENLARVLTTRGWLRFWLGDAAGGLTDARAALTHAASAGSPGVQAEAAGLVASTMRWGPTPWSELTKFIEERLASSHGALGGRLGASLVENRGAAEAAVGSSTRLGLGSQASKEAFVIEACSSSCTRLRWCAANSSFAPASSEPPSESCGRRGTVWLSRARRAFAQLSASCSPRRSLVKDDRRAPRPSWTRPTGSPLPTMSVPWPESRSSGRWSPRSKDASRRRSSTVEGPSP